MNFVIVEITLGSKVWYDFQQQVLDTKITDKKYLKKTGREGGMKMIFEKENKHYYHQLIYFSNWTLYSLANFAIYWLL